MSPAYAGRRRRRRGRRGDLRLPGPGDRVPAHVRDVFDGVLEPGRHRIALDPKAVRGESFVVARTTGSVLVRPVGG